MTLFNFTLMTFSSSFPSIPCSCRLVPCAGASPVFGWRRSGVHVSCGGPGGGDKVGPRQSDGTVPSVSGPVHVLGPAGLRPQPRLHLAPQHPLRRFSNGEGGGAGATPPARPRPNQYRLHPYWWGNVFFLLPYFFNLFLFSSLVSSLDTLNPSVFTSLLSHYVFFFIYVLSFLHTVLAPTFRLPPFPLFPQVHLVERLPHSGQTRRMAALYVGTAHVFFVFMLKPLLFTL